MFSLKISGSVNQLNYKVLDNRKLILNLLNIFPKKEEALFYV